MPAAETWFSVGARNSIGISRVLPATAPSGTRRSTVRSPSYCRPTEPLPSRLVATAKVPTSKASRRSTSLAMPGKRARQVAERIDADAHLGECLRQRALDGDAEVAAGELHIAVRVALERLADGFEERPPVLRLHALRHRDDAAAVAVPHGGDVVDEALHREAPLRHVDEVRSVGLALPPRRSGGGEEAGVPAHDDGEIDAGHRAEIEVEGEEGAGDEPGRGNEAGRMVVLDEIVVDRLRRVDEGDVRTGGVEDLHACRRCRCRRHR